MDNVRSLFVQFVTCCIIFGFYNILLDENNNKSSCCVCICIPGPLIVNKEGVITTLTNIQDQEVRELKRKEVENYTAQVHSLDSYHGYSYALEEEVKELRNGSYQHLKRLSPEMANQFSLDTNVAGYSLEEELKKYRMDMDLVIIIGLVIIDGALLKQVFQKFTKGAPGVLKL